MKNFLTNLKVLALVGIMSAVATAAQANDGAQELCETEAIEAAQAATGNAAACQVVSAHLTAAIRNTAAFRVRLGCPIPVFHFDVTTRLQQVRGVVVCKATKVEWAKDMY